MRLTHFVIHNFRRFVDVSINLDHKVVALVGPNDAGKTTVLEALERLNGGVPMQPGDYPRNDSPSAGVVFEAWFLLRTEDHEAIDHIRDGESVRWLVRHVHHDGNSEWEIRPTLERDARSREAAIERLRTVSQAKWADTRLDFEGVLGTMKEATYGQLLELLANFLDSADNDLTSEQATAIREVADRLSNIGSRATDGATQLSTQLTELAELEEAPDPERTALDLLTQRVPRFVKFTEEDRLLQPEYDLNQINPASPPTALGNLLWLANTTVQALRNGIGAGDRGASLQTLLDSTNERLRKAFHGFWTQSAISVFLRVDTSILQILIKSEPGGYASIASSSDGLRSFVALRAFVARHSYQVKPVLLVDEAESHLHYDAQADLVRVFTRQNVASQVIYSTHSAGCLPQDLGTAIKPVSPVSPDRSTIRNSFWTEGPGLNTLMLALGSTTFAFVPSRYAVVGEGPADVVLLPSLLREVTGRDELDFQVVPGTSELTPQQILEIDAQAQHVVYLVDSDEGGQRIASRLRSAGVAEDSIVEIGLDEVEDLTLEDLVDPHVYADAINEELIRSGRAEVMSAESLPEVRRSYFVANLFNEMNVKPPNKTLVAGRIVEKTEGDAPADDRPAYRSIVDKSRADHLRQLYGRLTTALGIPTS